MPVIRVAESVDAKNEFGLIISVLPCRVFEALQIFASALKNGLYLKSTGYGYYDFSKVLVGQISRVKCKAWIFGGCKKEDQDWNPTSLIAFLQGKGLCLQMG